LVKVFQFLLGRLETAAPGGNSSRTNQFQFLLGRLETIEELGERIAKLEVSIPLR